MTLPSTRRPPEVERLLQEEEVEAEGPGSLKMRVDLKYVFMESMKAWYDTLNPEEQLTKKQIIRRAVQVAYNLRLPYENLPENWLRILHHDHGLKFRISRKKGNRSKYLWTTTSHHGSGSEQTQKRPHKELMTKTKFDDKKFVDLTMEPPPQYWMDAYMTKQYILPRTLKVVKTLDDVTVMYYDYPEKDAKPEENAKKLCPRTIPHDRDGVWGK